MELLVGNIRRYSDRIENLTEVLDAAQKSCPGTNSCPQPLELMVLESTDGKPLLTLRNRVSLVRSVVMISWRCSPNPALMQAMTDQHS